MNIEALIERDYASVSILEDTRDLSLWLREKDYFVVLDEDCRPVGVVTMTDLQQDGVRQLIDCEMTKPCADSHQDVKAVYELMKNSHCLYLPVYEGHLFAGVVSLWAIATCLLELCAL